MSTGGQAQLVAIGPQDEHLSEDPQASFFHASFKRHVNFSRVTSVEVIQGTPQQGGMSTVKFQRNGDLLNFVYVTLVDLTLQKVVTVTDWRNVIDYVELYIGGSLIDVQSAEFCELVAIDTMAQNLTMSSAGGHHNGAGHVSEFYPMRFFFNQSVSSSLPLCALKNVEVEIRIHWATGWYTPVPVIGPSGSTTLSPTVPSNFKFEVYSNYIFLAESERERFLKKPIDMLIYQVQSSPASKTHVQNLEFNHPIKYLASSSVPLNELITYDSTGVVVSGPINGLCDAHTKVKLQINGEDVGDFKYAVPHFTSVMSYYHCPFDNGNFQTHFLYPFCIDTSRLQPTGTLNWSRLDSVKLITDGLPITGTVYGVNYNILRIENGQCGLMYAN